MRATQTNQTRARRSTRAYGAPRGEQGNDDPTIDRPSTEYPTADEVQRFHKNADTDARPEALHHTLGPGNGQAAAGDHNHRGQDSALLLEGVLLTGSKSASPPTAVLTSIVNALAQLGATDSTS